MIRVTVITTYRGILRPREKTNISHNYPNSGPHYVTDDVVTRNSAVADKPRNAFVQMQRRV